MKLISGEIEPGIRISNYLIGSKKEDVITNLDDNYFAYIPWIILNYGLELMGS